MQMDVVRKLVILCLAAAFSGSCGKDYENLEKDRVAIESYFESYFKGLPEEEAVTARAAYDVAGGVYRYVQNSDRTGYANAAVAARGDAVEFYYEGYAFSTELKLDDGNYNPSLIFATNRPETLDYLCGQMLTPPGESAHSYPAWDRTLWGDEPTVVTVGNATLVEGVAKGLVGVREGDMVWMVFASDLGFGEKELGAVGMNQILAYRIYVEKVTKRQL